MALKDHKPNEARRPTGKPCSVQELLDRMNDADRAELLSWMFRLGYSQEAIFKGIKNHGETCGKQTINRHRSGSCRCFQ